MNRACATTLVVAFLKVMASMQDAAGPVGLVSVFVDPLGGWPAESRQSRAGRNLASLAPTAPAPGDPPETLVCCGMLVTLLK